MRNEPASRLAKWGLRTLESTGVLGLYKSAIYPLVNGIFFMHMVYETRNFSNVKWLGQPIWQNILDLWVIQETIVELRPDLLIETGTNRGGSALFYAHLFDLMDNGTVVSIDIEKMHDLAHPRVKFIIGDSTADDVLDMIRQIASSTTGPIMVILDSDHSPMHVRAELERYSLFVTPKSYLLVQDGVIDTLPIFRFVRPGPMRAIEDFLHSHPEFKADANRSKKFLISHHPSGWLMRK